MPERYFKVRRVNSQVNAFQVTYPFAILERAAQARGISVVELVKRVHVVAKFDSTDVVTYTLVDNPPNESPCDVK